jgi:UPF0271 protein
MKQIDLNADLGEGYGPWRMGEDEALLDVLSSANIACGFHAGDPAIMDATVRAARAKGADVGAHVGFPDRQGFGRRVLQMDTAELASTVVYQLGALSGIARRAGARMTHMSFHGALGNMTAADPELARHLVGAVAEFDASLLVLTSASRAIEDAADANGLRATVCFLADRAYGDDGLLVPRKMPASVIKEPAQVIERVARLLADRTIVTYSGAVLPMPCASILLHGDTPGAVTLARAIRAAVQDAGATVTPLSQHAS